MNRQNKYFIYVSIVVLIIIGFGLFRYFKSGPDGDKAVVTINKDTGQTIIDYPNQGPQTYGSSNYVVILGANKLIPAGMTDNQFNSVEGFITNYINFQLKRKYTQVSILNDGFRSTTTSISAKLRLGNSQTLLNLTILYPTITQDEVKISSTPANPYYTYDSGLQTVGVN